MWTYDSDYKRWVSTDDKLTIDNFEFLKQELSSYRLYSKCLSGASYLPMNDIDNIYDILGEYTPKNWYISIDGSQYTNTLIPAANAEPINGTSSYDYYTKYLSEYGLTLKTLFTPNRLISDSINNYIYVDVATTEQLFDLNQSIVNRNIDGVRLKDGHRVLIKDQKTKETLLNTVDPDTYFVGPYEVVQNLGATIEYEYYNSDNGIYVYQNGLLTKENDLYDYDNCVRFSVIVKLGNVNREKQFHLSRLNNGYYPTSQLNQPMEFIEKKNWMLRNRVDYNNLFELNYYDVLKHGTQSYNLLGVTYSIPERIISVGEFGVIHVYQENYSNIIRNKYKVNLRSITQTSTHYWICGDDGVLLKVGKHDFSVEKVNLPIEVITPLRSVSFYSDLRGVVVGDLNMIFVTSDGGMTWEKITISGFSSYYYNKVIYYSPSAFFIGGNAGVFIEFKNDISGWTAYKRRISRFIDDDDEYLLVDNINDIFYTNINTWGLSFSYGTQSTGVDKEVLFIVTDDSKIIVHDINDSIATFDFVYLDFPDKYGDIMNITRRSGTNDFYFTGISELTGDIGLFSFNISNFEYIGVDNQYSNTIVSTFSAVYESSYYSNDIFDYNGTEMIICGNESLLYSSTYSTSFNFQVFDVTFEDRLKSKMVFLDYDAGSKLNFFRDNGEYRLPNSISVTASLTSSHIGFDPIVVGTVSENNWVGYFQDRSMTFEYYSTSPMVESTKVVFSTDFYTSTYSVFDAINITNDPNDILPLAPTILDKGHSRFNGFGLTAISTPPSYDLYLHDYLMIAKVPFNYSVNRGDILRLESNTVTGNFMVNKILSIGAVPATTDIFAIYDTTSMNISDAATASIQLKNWFSDYCSDNPYYQGNLYILPSGTERWLRLPDLVYTGSLSITALAGSSNWDLLSEVISYTQSVTNLTGSGTLASIYFNAFGSTWSAPDNLLLISFIDESNSEYHGPTAGSTLGISGDWALSQPYSAYINDYNQFVNFRSPLTGGTSSKFNYFRGILYPIVRGSGTGLSGANFILNGFCASLVMQSVAAMYGYTMSQSEVDSIPGIATDYTVGYLGSSFSSITNNTNSGWNAGETRINVTPLIQGNPYSSLIDPNGDPGLLQHGWVGFFDKRNRKRNVGLGIDEIYNPFNPADFSDDLDSLVESPYGTDKYLYMFSEFNENITTGIKNETLNPTYSITLTNLNRYDDLDDLNYRFNLHPISNGYELLYENSVLTINPKFNNLTSYYNLATVVGINSSNYTMEYTDGFMKFGYTPTYNLLDYLESINSLGDPNPVFYPDKEYYAMPDYRGIPMPGDNFDGNKITFGSDLEFEWNSIFINTFIDINLYDSSIYSTPSSTTERLLVMKKYANVDGSFTIEFDKRINYTTTVPLYFIDIISRRKLHQISSDLQYINNIQRPQNTIEYIGGTTQSLQLWNVSYTAYERDLNFKINTDSYAKILLSDSDTVESLSAILYTDYKNELAMNVTRLERENNVQILTTAAFTPPSYTYPVLFISCLNKHELKDVDGVVLEFNGGTGSSQELNQQYFGYHTVTVVNEYSFYVDIPYGTVPLVGNDTGFVKYIRKDSFLNFQPVDLIDIGVDKKGKIAIELLPDNVKLDGDTYSLINIDYDRYRFRLVDGLNVETLAINFSWIYEAEISRAVIGYQNELTWYSGDWECGRWFGGRWISGNWISGDWYGGTWESKLVKDNWINVEVDEKSSDRNRSVWYGGRWYDGTWNNGTWVNGRWYDGTWNNGLWLRGIWNDGTWNSGLFNGGIWVHGTWNSGTFNTDSEPSYWLDGEWYGGDFENGIWYNGIFDERNVESRFGVRAYNSRTANWHGGKWIKGSFHSRLNVNDNDEYDVSDSHKYSIWRTGQWFGGNFYGGIAYNMDYKSGTWYGGILEDIQVIGVSSNNYFVLNGIFKFNIGDEITIIDNQIGGSYSSFGSNSNPQKYTVLYTVEDTINKWTNVYVDSDITINVVPPVDMGIRLVSRFRSCNWKSGIWTNGIYDSGQWEGGIWYNGIFNATWM